MAVFDNLERLITDPVAPTPSLSNTIDVIVTFTSIPLDSKITLRLTNDVYFGNQTSSVLLGSAATETPAVTTTVPAATVDPQVVAQTILAINTAGMLFLLLNNHELTQLLSYAFFSPITYII